MTARSLRIGALTLAIAVAVTACGSDASDTATTTVTGAALPATESTAPPTITAGSSAAPAPTTGATTTVATPTTADPASARVTLTPIVTLQQPVAMALRPGDDALYIAERVGRVRVVRNGELEPDPLLDITELTRAEGERGLLGLAFAPEGDRLYVNYTDAQGDTHVDEFAVQPDGRVDQTSQREVLFQDQPYPNHNGGHLVFGPDGYLYIGLGDGGSQRDPDRRGLDLGTWLGKILRIDPRPAGDAPFTVPPDNPFVADTEALPEIWSYGLRNPWRFAFDPDSGDLWIGDVGQNAIEEVSLSRASDGAGRGVSFGWSAYEGTNPINDDQPSTGHVPPVYEYPHDLGCSITGGSVYRGEAIPELQGAYVFADYCVPGVRAISLDASGEATAAVDLTTGPGAIASFGEDLAGELYVLSLQGDVARIDPA